MTGGAIPRGLIPLYTQSPKVVPNHFLHAASCKHGGSLLKLELGVPGTFFASCFSSISPHIPSLLNEWHDFLNVFFFLTLSYSFHLILMQGHPS